MKWMKHIMILILLSTSFIVIPQTSEASSHLDVQARSAILVDANSGRILYGKNINDSLPVASMSKMMTQYLVLENIQKGTISWDTVYKAKKIDQLLSTKPGLSNIPLYEGEEYTVKELYDSMMIVSANASSRALGEIVGKTDKHFVEMMNQKAKELKLTRSYFVNTSGLNNTDLAPYIVEGTNPTDENHMSSHDLAILAYRIAHDFPNQLSAEQIEKKPFHVTETIVVEMINTNQMLPNGKYAYDGIIGMKTGTNEAAGYGFTSLAKRDSRTFITVIIDGKNKENQGTSKARFAQTKKLLDYGFHEWHYEKLSPVDFLPEKKRTVTVEKGKQDATTLSAKRKKILVLKNEPMKAKAELALTPSKWTEQQKLKAPVEKGEKVGKVQLVGDTFDYLTPELEKAAVQDVYVKEEIKKENWFVLLFKKMFS